MPRMKMWAVPMREAIVPGAWIGGAKPNGSTQADLILFAPAKADLAPLLGIRRMAMHTAQGLARHARWVKDGQAGRTWQMLLDLGAVDPTREGVYAAKGMVKGDVVNEILPGGAVKPVARFDYESGIHGRGLFAELIPARKIVAESGAEKELPPGLEVDKIAGLDGEGRIVMDWFGARDGARDADFLFGLTLCCNASDKGVESGIVCRGCYGTADVGAYLYRLPDGRFPGLDPVKEIL